MGTITVLLVDDQKLFVDNLKTVLDLAGEDIEVVGIAYDGEQAVRMVGQLKPRIVLMDVRMPVMDGVRATELIRRSRPAAKIIMLTTFDDDASIDEALRLGAVGYLLKDISTEELISSIRAASSGAVMVSATVVQKMLHRKQEAAATPADRGRQEVLRELSRREIAILRLLAQGEGNKEIGLKMNAAEQTIKNVVSTIYTKLGVDNRREARRFALETGLINLTDLLR